LSQSLYSLGVALFFDVAAGLLDFAFKKSKRYNSNSKETADHILCQHRTTELTRKSMEAKNIPQMHIVYKRQKLQSNITCTPRHDKENVL